MIPSPLSPPALAIPGTGDACVPAWAAVRVGHVRLRVASVERAAGFYGDVLGVAISVDERAPAAAGASQAAIADGHRGAGFDTEIDVGPPLAASDATGVNHAAFLFPDRVSFGDAVRRLLALGYPIDSAEDHGGAVVVYLRDPDGNGVELYYDRPRAEWFDLDGGWTVKADQIDVRELVADGP